MIRHRPVVVRQNRSLISFSIIPLSRLHGITIRFSSLSLSLYLDICPSLLVRSAPRLFLSFIFIHCLSPRPFYLYFTFLSSSRVLTHARDTTHVRARARAYSCAAKPRCVFHSRSLLLSLSLVGGCNTLSPCRSRSFLPPPLRAARYSVSLFPPCALRFFFQPPSSCTETTWSNAERARRTGNSRNARTRPC